MKTLLLRKNKFYATTPLTSLRNINASNSVIEIVVWYFILIFFGAITFGNVSDLIHEYVSGQTVTLLKLGSSTNMTRIPSTVFCVRNKIPELNAEFLLYESEISPFHVRVPSLNVQLGNTLKKLNTTEQMMSKEPTWDFVLLPLLFRYFTALAMVEIRPKILANPEQNEFIGGVDTFLFDYELKIKEAILLTLNHSRKLNVSDMQLFDKFSRELALFAGFEMSYLEYNVESYREQKLSFFLRFFGYSGGNYPVFCFMADEDQLRHVQSMTIDAHSQLMATASLFNRNYIINNTYGFTYSQLLKSLPPKVADADEQLVVLLGGELGVTDFMKSADFSADFGRQVVTHVRPIAIHKSFTNCSPLPSKDACLLKCKVGSIRKLCGCTPLMDAKSKTSTDRAQVGDLCHLDHYLRCLNDTVAVKDDLRCDSTCTSPCTDVRYTIQDAHWKGWTQEPRATVFMSAIESDFPIYAEQFAQPWQSFFGEVGGTLDLYLGASVIAAIHLCVFLFKQVIYILYNRERYASANQGLKTVKHEHHAHELASLVALTPVIAEEPNEEVSLLTEKDTLAKESEDWFDETENTLRMLANDIGLIRQSLHNLQVKQRIRRRKNKWKR